MSMNEKQTVTMTDEDRLHAARWRWFRSNCAAAAYPLYGIEFRIPDSGPGIDIDADDQSGWPAYLDEMADGQIAGVAP